MATPLPVLPHSLLPPPPPPRKIDSLIYKSVFKIFLKEFLKKFTGRFFLIERKHFLRTSAVNCCKYMNRIEPNLIFDDCKLTVNNHAPGMAQEKFKYS